MPLEVWLLCVCVCLTPSSYFEDVDGQVYRKPTSAYQKLYGRFTGKRIEYLNVTRNMKSGDGTVPYHSLSWCNTWCA